ncbi:MAG: LPXTG cell wall anchor domain-containing protein [Acidobacteriota bacterium]
MKKTTLAVIAASFLFAVAAQAQTPQQRQSSGPTSNEYQIRVTEPVEGAVIQGPDFNVVLSTPNVPTGTSMSPAERKDSLRPVFQVFVDGKDMGNIPNDQNVYAVHTESFGAHKLVVLAKNGTGQVIDRKEISLSTTDVSASASMSTSTSSTMPAAAAPAPPARTDTMATHTTEAPAPSAAPVPESSRNETYTASSSTLPKTASDYPAAALAGLALAGAGLWLRRRS